LCIRRAYKSRGGSEGGRDQKDAEEEDEDEE
jgi:hypothetical protein